MKKLFITLSLALCMCISCSGHASAQAQTSFPSVTIEEEASNIPQELIDDILKENPDAEHITITEYVPAENNSDDIVPYGYDYFDITKKTTQSRVLAKTELVISVAKGQTTSLSSSWSATLSASVTGELPINKLNLGASVTQSYTRSDTFVGPPEGSQYKTRKYYVGFYEARGTYSALRVSDINPANRVTITGNWSSPLDYVAYSTDSRV